MVVGLTPAQEAACRRAIVPVEVVATRDVREACASMSTVLPLVVVVDEAMPDADRAALTEMTTACGAEIVAAAMADANLGSTKDLSEKLLAALRVAELRRLSYKS
jgi:hypothetical protein